MFKVVLFITILALSFSTLADERVQWEQGKVVALELQNGDERQVIFPEQVRFAFKSEYADLFTYSLIDRTLFIQPLSDFSERLTFQGIGSGAIYILDANAADVNQKAKTILRIDDTPQDSPEDAPVPGSQHAGSPYSAEPVDPIDLVQHVAQTLYSSDEATIEPISGVSRAPVKTVKAEHLYRGGELDATVLAGWVGGGMYVTAVKFTNTTERRIMFEPCKLRGNWYSATPQFRRVFEKTHASNFTVVYLLSEVPFDQAFADNKGVVCN
jgi:integrating conjugative element protein (TIGR03749 family)